jgi:hypothetical protein
VQPLELRRATRLGPQRAKGRLSRLCCGQKQWLSWSADLQMVHPELPTTKNFAIILPSQSPAMVHLEVAVGCPAVARSQARRHPFVRPWGSAIGHWSRKQMFQLTNDICWMTIVFGQMVLSMMNELQPRGPQLTRTDHLEAAASYHAISMRNALYFPIVEEYSTGFGSFMKRCTASGHLLLEQTPSAFWKHFRRLQT